MRAVALLAAMVSALVLGGCGNKDAGMCDFYKSLGAGYTQHQGYIPSDVQDQIDNYC